MDGRFVMVEVFHALTCRPLQRHLLPLDTILPYTIFRILCSCALCTRNPIHVQQFITCMQDRVRVDGRFVARQLPQQPPQNPTQQLQRPSWLPDTAPLVPPISQQQLEALADLLQEARNVVVLTGAGCSTESAIPDYRGPSGAYSTGFKPITHQQVRLKKGTPPPPRGARASANLVFLPIGLLEAAEYIGGSLQGL